MTAPLLTVRGLTKRFGGLSAVTDLDFEVMPGEILGVIGPNGAGKSTTFNMVAGAYAPSSGTISFAAERIDGLAPHHIAKRGVMRTFQHNRPFPGMSVRENVMVGMHTRFDASLWQVLAATRHAAQAERAAAERADELIDFVGLREFRAVDVTTLSFGQGRLLEIARALAGDPRLLLFDEPAAGLTPAECDRLVEIISSIAARGIAVLLIEHDMRFLLAIAQRVIVLNFGRKIAQGDPHQVRNDPAVIEAYLGNTMPDVANGAAASPQDGTAHA